MNGFQKALDEVGHHSIDEQGRRMTVEQIADRIGEPVSRLRKELSAYDEAHPLKASKVVPLTLATRNKALVRYFCEATGGVYVELPHVGAGGDDAMEHSMKAVKEFGEMLAQAGGKPSPSVAAAFRKEANEAIASIVQFMRWMDESAGVEPQQSLRAVEKGA